MDRRSHPRTAVRRPGQISLGGRRDFPCSIHNVSRRGAKLEVPAARWVGYGFDLKDVMSGVTRKCTVVWRSEFSLGICFVAGSEWSDTAQRASTRSFGRRASDRG